MYVALVRRLLRVVHYSIERMYGGRFLRRQLRSREVVFQCEDAAPFVVGSRAELRALNPKIAHLLPTRERGFAAFAG